MAASLTISTKNRLLRSLLLIQSSSYSSWTTKAWNPKFLRNQRQSPPIPEQEQLGFSEAAPSVPERQILGFTERTLSLPERDQPKFPEPAKVPPKELAGWPRPSEIAWEGRVPNSVNLSGSIKFPVQLQVSSDGRYWAFTVLVLEKLNNFPQFWIPIIFEGNLAQIAVCHLRENDLVYVTGQLIGDPPAVTLDQGRINNIQVMVQNLYFVRPTNSMQKTQTRGEKNEQAFECSDRPTKSQDSMESCWRDLIANPKQWLDYRMAKDNGSKSPKHPDFKHKNTGVALWLNCAPQWVLPALKKVDITVTSRESCWRDFIANPKQWWDNRQDKANGLNPNYPDFKHKGTGMGLWLNQAPLWVLSALEGLDFPVKTQNPEQGKAEHGSRMKKTDNAELWMDLAYNPDGYWDYRSTKLKASVPDFKNKETGEKLWLNSATPSWVLPYLPREKSKVDFPSSKRDSPSSEETRPNIFYRNESVLHNLSH